MRHVAAPTHVGAEQWPVPSAVRVRTAGRTADGPAEFVVLADCGKATPTEPFATFWVFTWPDRGTSADGDYHLTVVAAQRILAERASLTPRTTVEVVVVRDPDFTNDYTLVIDGQPPPTGESSAVRAVTHDIDLGASPITGEWVTDQLQAAGTLSPAAAYARDTVLAYADDPPDHGGGGGGGEPEVRR